MRPVNVYPLNFLATTVAFKQQRLQRGFKLFEFAVATAIFAILVTVLLQRMHFYQREAETVAVQRVVANIRTALEIKLVQGRLPGRQLILSQLAEQNPMLWLSEKPPNYAGEYFSPTEQDVAAGNWYFDRRDKVLVYLLNNANTLGSSGVKHLKFKVKLFRLPKSSVKPAGASDFDGVAFEQVNG
jgi:type II secretory pathway pseudopilin PulG